MDGFRGLNHGAVDLFQVSGRSRCGFMFQREYEQKVVLGSC